MAGSSPFTIPIWNPFPEKSPSSPAERAASDAPSRSACCTKARRWRSADATRESVDRAVAAMQPLGRIVGYGRRHHARRRGAPVFPGGGREFGGLDILVNNAGEGVFRKVGEMTPEEWHRNIDLNLNGAVLLLARSAGAISNAAAADSSSTFPASPARMPSAAAPDTTPPKRA